MVFIDTGQLAGKIILVFYYISPSLNLSLSNKTQHCQNIHSYSFCVKSDGVFQNSNALKGWTRIFSVKVHCSCYFVLRYATDWELDSYFTIHGGLWEESC